MSLDEDFISKVCNAFRKAVESASEVTIEGREREFRRVLARYLFDETLGWEGHSKIGEIYDITCIDEENFPIILVETKWGVEPTREIKDKLRKRIEELGSVKYGVFASERDFIVYEYADLKLEEITKINVAEATGVARGEYGLSDDGKKRILRLELLKRERLVWVEEPEYFERTYKEISITKAEGTKLLINNLKGIVEDLATAFMNFFDSYRKREYHYSSRFLRNTFTDWLKLSMKYEDYEKVDEDKKKAIMKVFCRETAYVLLGRALFVRICEDKGILEQSLSGKRLAEYLRFYGKRRTNIYLHAFYDSREEIKNYYSHLHELGYFDWWWISPEKRELLNDNDRREQDRLEKDLDDKICKCLRRLNRFNFTQVDRDILGDVYQGYLPPDERKRLGEFYTPKEVIEYILDAVGYKPENEIRGKKLLDPACGSGGFLVEATQRLIERYRRIGFNLRNPDDAKQIIDGCINSIYGLDIHPFACFIAEMNLLFQLVDLYCTAQQKDKYFKFPRIKIYQSDSLMPPTVETVKLIEFFDNSRLKMLIEENKEANEIKKSKFDYVVGNPPYVRIEGIPLELRSYYRKLYDSAHYRFDLYMLFIERGITWLKDEGKFGFIVSNMFMKRDSGRKLREFIRSECSFEQIVDFGDSGVFAEVTNYPAIVILRKEKSEKYVFRYVIVKQHIDGLLKSIKQHLIMKEYSCQAYDIFEADSSFLTEERWTFSGTGEEVIINKMKNSGRPLRDIAYVRRGLVTGANKVFIVNNEIVEKHGLEKELIKSIISGANVKKWEVEWDGSLIIYPHLSRGKSVDLRSYPEIANYLTSHKSYLEKRYCVIRERNPRKWYELHDACEPQWFETPKIIVCGISKKNEFAYDEEGVYYCLDSTFFITLKENVDFAYLLGVLNSHLLEFYFKHIAAIKSGGYYEYRSQYLNELPIKLPETDREKKIACQITQYVNQILQIKKQMRSTKRKVEKFPQSYFENGWSFDRLMNIAKVNLSLSAFQISADKIRTYSFKELEYPFREVFRIILTNQESMDFYSENVASYVFEVLKNMDRVTKRELLELEIPKLAYLKNLMNQYRKDREQIVKYGKMIEELERQIGDLVYKLYDITYAERRIIEDYLKKF